MMDVVDGSITTTGVRGTTALVAETLSDHDITVV